MPPSKTEYISTAELAELLNISQVAIFKRIKKKQIKAVKIGRSYAIPKNTLPAQFPTLSTTQKDLKEYVSVIEAAQILNVSRGTILNKINAGSLKADKVGRHYVIDKSQLAKNESEELYQDLILNKEYVSVPELAKILGISRIAVFKKIKKGQIKAQKVGRHYVIAREEVLTERGERASVPATEYMSVAEVAQQLNLNRIAVFKRIKSGDIKAIKIGRSYAIEKAELRSFNLRINRLDE